MVRVAGGLAVAGAIAAAVAGVIAGAVAGVLEDAMARWQGKHSGPQWPRENG